MRPIVPRVLPVGIYDMTQDNTLFSLATSNNSCLKSAINLLQTYAAKKETDLKNLEAILEKYIMDENTNRLLAEQEKQQLLEQKRQVTERERQVTEREKIFYRKIVNADIKNRKK